MSIKLRLASAGDAPQVLDIYAPYIRETAITFELEVPELDAFARRLAGISSRYPYIVAEESGGIMGYAYAAEQHERAAYQWNASLSVYLAPEARGRGLGTRLYRALMELLAQLGYRNFYGLVTLPNEASMKLHRKMGFSELCVLRRTGYKFGKWHDVAWVEKAAGSFEDVPQKPLNINELEDGEVRRVLERYS